MGLLYLLPLYIRARARARVFVCVSECARARTCLRALQALDGKELFYACWLNRILTMIKFRKLQCPGHVFRIGDIRNTYRILLRKPYDRPRMKWEVNMKIDLRETGCGNG